MPTKRTTQWGGLAGLVTGVIAAVFLMLIIWLIFMPKRLHGERGKAVRMWATIIATFQMLIYLFWK